MPGGTRYLVAASVRPSCLFWVFRIETDRGDGSAIQIDETESDVPIMKPCPSFPMKLIPETEKRATVMIRYMDRNALVQSPNIHHWRAEQEWDRTHGDTEAFGGSDYYPDDAPIALTRLSTGEVARRTATLLAEAVESEQATLTAFNEMKRQRDEALELLKTFYVSRHPSIVTRVEIETKTEKLFKDCKVEL